ncbi:TPM domain-containing protein [Marivirga sp. S37H4]|uniref:TPM domain-containing protein n=1 Tax=Marivirga aurantiaca TaxID=2802615 RepID=A0A935C894_9BACT|nr:TPM domain-containing protein [Marivirga aurantiaca]MBK6265481.1 TPM domain-containing protein [Marivirga aurantiaca]
MAKDSFSKEEKQQIEQAIKTAELKTSGEIQVHLENHCKEDVMDRAAHIFKVLKMHKTAERNGVLFYMAIKDHKFAILGDVGINQKVPDHFWDDIKEQMLLHFKKDEITKGLSKGIAMAGEQLSAHFPYQKDDDNELSDEISFGKN